MRGMVAPSSHERMLRVLDLIEESATPLTSDDMADRLGFTRSTLYRHLKNLSDAGLVTSFPDVGYALGPRVAELDYKMRNGDPLIIASRPVMAELVEVRAGIALLCRRYRDRVLCVHQESRGAGFASTYERGRALPLFRGAASRIILAHLPARSIQRLYEADRRAFAEGRLGKSLAAAKAALKEMRQRGWDITESQVTRDVTGIAAPIFDDRGGALGSLSLTVGRTKLAEAEIGVIAERVTFCARIVTKALSGSRISKNPMI
jgi:DNA-binding IclR family transcriptional regulator